GCAWLLDNEGYRVQATYKDFCDHGADISVEYDLDTFDVMPGDVLTICSQGNLSNCGNRVTVREAGDLDGDGDINVADLMLIHELVLEGDSNWWPTSDLDLEAADRNGDGAVNVIDILLLVQHIWE
ncbi:MAG: dockerin type I repeat-containing protein, partial [Myxococcota bacterium]|nr:dockerin type I repeat-containing protein [Myxococcota bacterium]